MDQAQPIRQSKKARFAWALLGLHAALVLALPLLAAFGRSLDADSAASLASLVRDFDLFVAAPYLLGQSAVDYAKARSIGGA